MKRLFLTRLNCLCLSLILSADSAAQERVPLSVYPEYPFPESQPVDMGSGYVPQDSCCESSNGCADGQCQRGSGLLGRTYLRSSYIHVGINDPVISSFDDALQGFDIEFNSLVPWLSTNRVGVDMSAEYDLASYSGTNAGNSIDVDGHSVFIGTRIFLKSAARIKPYVTLGVSFLDLNLQAGNSTGNVFSGNESDTDFYSSVGAELEITNRLSARADFEVVPDDFESGLFEGTLVFWPTERFFIRGGILAPFNDNGLGAGGVIGGGVSF